MTAVAETEPETGTTETGQLLRVPRTWVPRPYQYELWEALCDGAKRADVAAHRRWGKDEVALHWAAWAVQNRPGGYWHLLPEASQGRKAIWDAVNPHTGARRIEEAFADLNPTFHDSEMMVRFGNGSTWQVLGSDNHDSLMGASVVGVVFSEWSLARPDSWAYIRPILLENNGWALFLWTPRGRNHATTAFESRQEDKEWFTLRAPATETDVFTAEQLDRERRELVAELGSEGEGRAKFASEYLVDFDAAAPGAYYAEALSEAGEAGRISAVPVDPSLRVDTAWDLGIDDYTSIWYFQQVGREIRVVDYFETSGVGLDSIVREAIAARPYIWGTHHLPHDVMVREFGTGRSRYETLGSLGLTRIAVGSPANPEDRVNAARLMIPICWFDAERCAVGLERLRTYRKRWSRAIRSFGGPLHDQASHGADAFGEFALSRRGAVTVPPTARRTRQSGALSWMC